MKALHFQLLQYATKTSSGMYMCKDKSKALRNIRTGEIQQGCLMVFRMNLVDGFICCNTKTVADGTIYFRKSAAHKYGLHDMIEDAYAGNRDQDSTAIADQEGSYSLRFQILNMILIKHICTEWSKR